MIIRVVRAMGLGATTLALALAPAHGQWIVYDPTNFSQNALSAARALEQVNNSLQSLENQATMLVNQARNLASLPYSSLAELEQSISQTQQLLGQAQHIAYSVTAIDQAFTQTYPQAYSNATSSEQLVADASALDGGVRHALSHGTARGIGWCARLPVDRSRRRVQARCDIRASTGPCERA